MQCTYCTYHNREAMTVTIVIVLGAKGLRMNTTSFQYTNNRTVGGRQNVTPTGVSILPVCSSPEPGKAGYAFLALRCCQCGMFGLGRVT